MKPIDMRNETWEQARVRLTKDMQRVYDAVRVHGPGTTRQIAESAGLSLLTLRPRVTDLHDLFLIDLVGKEGTEGIYRVVEVSEAEKTYNGLRQVLLNNQGLDGKQTELIFR